MIDAEDSPVVPRSRRRGAAIPAQPGAADDRMTDAPGGRAAARAAQGSGRGPGRRGNGAPRRARRAGRRPLRIIAIVLSVLVLITAGVGFALYEHLNGNIHGVPLGDAGSEKPDAFGRTPINLLVIGSDGRDNPEDCKIGGDCGPGQNADVEMLVHISADRSNATAMSVPRDTMTDLPACKDPETGKSVPARRDQINSSLQYGPACTVAAVHRLTGVPIDHFAMVDFVGVVKMSDAVGGVDVCVSDNVYDPYSHLKLKQGQHNLKGMAALQFVRTRHGFGDGSDLGRTYGQHLFLGALIRNMKSAGTLANPAKSYSLADAATKALTVDNGIASIPKLLGLADDLNKVPSDRITFTTMQNVPDPHDDSRVLVSPAAHNLFDAIINDQSLTTAGGDKSSAAASATSNATAAPGPTTAAVPNSRIAVRVENGTGTPGRASAIAGALTGKGFSPGTTSGNAPGQITHTALYYGSGQQAEAKAVARALGLPAARLKQSSGGAGSHLILVVGTDWPSGSTYPGGDAKPAPADTAAAVSDAHAQTADQSTACAKVSHYRTVSLNGVPMTPIQAYAKSPDHPDSAP